MAQRSDFYVYVYIDPRNYEEFYYGKGCRGRKDVHLDAFSEFENPKHIRALLKKVEKPFARVILALLKEGLKPIIRVIAKGLSEKEAFLVETTLIWKQRRHLTNLVHGQYSKHFRESNQMHIRLPGFDFSNDIYYVNVSEGNHRSWEDCRRFGFLAAGNLRHWSKQLEKLHPGDIVVAYLNKQKGYKEWGYAGVGIVETCAVPVNQFRSRGKPLHESELEQPGLFEYANDPERAQYLVGIHWEKDVPRDKAKFRRNAGLYTPRRVVASLAKQSKTRTFVEEAFNVSLDALASGLPRQKKSS